VLPVPPALPRGLADPRPVIAVGTLAWLVAALVWYLSDAPATWGWTCAVGVLLGFVGFTVSHLQRHAAQRGAKGAQRGLL
jgi:fatty acid desaturase